MFKKELIDIILVKLYIYNLYFYFFYIKWFAYFLTSNKKYAIFFFQVYLFSWVSIQVFYLGCLIEEYLFKYEIIKMLPVVDNSADFFEIPQNFFKKPICFFYCTLLNEQCFMKIHTYSILKIYIILCVWFYYIQFLDIINEWLTAPPWWGLKQRTIKLKDLFLFIFFKNKFSVFICYIFFFYANYIFYFYRKYVNNYFDVIINVFSYLLKINFLKKFNYSLNLLYFFKYCLLFSRYFFFSNLMFLWRVIYNNNNWIFDFSNFLDYTFILFFFNIFVIYPCFFFFYFLFLKNRIYIFEIDYFLVYDDF